MLNAVRQMALDGGPWGVALIGLGPTALTLSFAAALVAWGGRMAPSRVLGMTLVATVSTAFLLGTGILGSFLGWLRLLELTEVARGVEAARLDRFGPRLANAPLHLALWFGLPASGFTGAAWVRMVRSRRRHADAPWRTGVRRMTQSAEHDAVEVDDATDDAPPRA